MSEQYKNYLTAKTRIFYSFRENQERGPKMIGIDCRPLGLLRQDVDMIVLRDTENNRIQWKHAQATFGYSDNQVIWIDSDKDFLTSTPKELHKVLSIISDRITFHRGVLIVPRVVTKEFIAACQTHDFEFAGTCINDFEGKSCLHTDNLVKETLSFKHLDVSVLSLRGQTGITQESLIQASKDLVAVGIKKAIFKPKEFEGGVGVQLVDLLEGSGGILNVPQEFFEIEWILEEFVDDVQKTLVATCWGIEVLSISDQIQSGFAHTGNLYPSRANDNIQEACQIICKKLASLLRIDCPWGMDAILSYDENGQPRLSVVDINLARFCGGHYPSLYGEARGLNIKSWLTCKHPDDESTVLLDVKNVVKKFTGYSTYIYYISV